MPQIGIEKAVININLGKRKQRSQMCEIFTIDGRILPIEQDAGKGCMIDEKKGKAFIIDETNQMTAEDGSWYQILGENSVLPLPLVSDRTYVKDEVGTKNDPLHKLINQIFHESQEAAKLEQYVQATRKMLLDKLTQIVAIPSVAFLIIFAVNTFRH